MSDYVVQFKFVASYHIMIINQKKKKKTKFNQLITRTKQSKNKDTSSTF